jgi:catalase
MFYRSMTDLEQAHIVEAFTFELGKCYEEPIRERMLGVLANVDTDLCAQVAAGLGLPAPTGKPATNVTPSPALSQVVDTPGPITGRVIGVIASPGADLKGIGALREAVEAEGAVLRVIAKTGGQLGRGAAKQPIERTFLTTRSIEYDAILVADGSGDIADIKVNLLVQEAFHHCKTLGAWGNGTQLLENAGLDISAPGVIVSEDADADFGAALIASVGVHRAWARAELVMAAGQD